MMIDRYRRYTILRFLSIIVAVIVFLTIISPILMFFSRPAGGATAEEPTAEQPTAEESAIAKPTGERSVMLLLDLSASMNVNLSGSSSRLDEAKNAIKVLLAELPEKTKIGLRVYGDKFATVSPDKREESCLSDSRLLFEPGDLNRTALIETVQGLDAKGDTPIALAADTAADDVPLGDIGSVILVTDGRDECYDADLDGDPAVGPSWGPPPCEIASKIAKEREGLKVHVVGFDTSNADIQNVACLAEETGGSIVSVNDAASLAKELAELAAGKPRIIELLGGVAVNGTLRVADAPIIEGIVGRTSRYVDTLTQDQNLVSNSSQIGYRANYRVSFLRGETLNATATVFRLPNDSEQTLALSLIAADGRELLRTDRKLIGRNSGRKGVDSIRLVGWALEQDPGLIDATLQLEFAGPEVSGDRDPENVLPQELDVELTLDGPAVLGSSPNCEPKTVCQYSEVVPALEKHVDDLKTGAVVPTHTEVEDPLETEVAALETELNALGSEPADKGQLPITSVLFPFLIGVALAVAVTSYRLSMDRR